MPKFYEIKNQTETSSDLYIYGDIVTEKWNDKDETSTDLKSFRELVEGLTDGQTLNIYLNSGGGSVFAASAMVSMLKRAQERGVKVVSYIDGLAASAASLFPMVSDETHIYSNSMLMIHKPIMLVVAVMNANDLTKCADELESVENGTLIPIYKSRTKLSDQKLKNAIANETWYTADEIVENFEGFTLHDEEKSAAACTSNFFARYQHTPEAFATVAAAVPVNDQTPAEPEPEGNKQDKPDDMTSVYKNLFILKKKGRM